MPEGPVNNRKDRGNLLQFIPPRQGAPAVEARTAQRPDLKLLQLQADALGVEDSHAIPEAEVQRGKQLDPAVSLGQLRYLQSLRNSAQAEFFEGLQRRSAGENRLQVLTAPTSRVVDHMVDGVAVRLLFERLLTQGRKDELLRAINQGPADGSQIWEQPADPIELVAGMIRWAYLTDHHKKRMRAPTEVRQWIEESLALAGYASKSRLGGASAVGATLAAALQHNAAMVCLGKVPANVSQLMGDNFELVTDQPEIDKFSEIELDHKEPGHYAVMEQGVFDLLPEEVKEIEINGQMHTTGKRRLDLLVTGASGEPGFGKLGLERFAELGQRTDITLLSGVQNLRNEEEIVPFFARVKALHDSGSIIALLYSEPKQKELEQLSMRAIRERRCVDYLSMNSLEAVGLLSRMQQHPGTPPYYKACATGALRIGNSNSEIWGSGHENPEWILRSAALIQELLEIPLVRVRGKAVDILVCAADVEISDPHAVRASLLMSRDMATLKVADPKGVISSINQIVPLANPPDGKYLAALNAVGKALAALENRENSVDALFGWRCFERLKDGRMIFATAPLPFYDRAGGTQSAGDTIDCTFATEQARGLLRKCWERSIDAGEVEKFKT